MAKGRHKPNRRGRQPGQRPEKPAARDAVANPKPSDVGFQPAPSPEPAGEPEAVAETPPAAPVTAAPTSRIVSINMAAIVLDVDRSVVERWIKREGGNVAVIREGGLGRGNEWQIDLGKLWTWWGEHNRRQALEEAGVGRHIEPKDREVLLKVARLAKLVVPVAVVEALLAQVLKDARTTLYAIVGRLVRAMAGLPPEKVAAFKAMADTGVREALEEFERALCDIDLSPSEDVIIVEGAGGRHDNEG